MNNKSSHAAHAGNPTLMRLSALSGLLSAICWLIGDILIVGFVSDPADYPLFMEADALLSKELAALMVTGSTERLAAGALFGAFSIPFMFLALYHIYFILRPFGKRYAVLSVSVLFTGFAWSPLAHAAFFYVGEAAKAALAVEAAGAARLIELVASFEKILYVIYIPAVAATAAGWILVSAAMLRRKSVFPRCFAFLTPFPASIACMLIVPLLPAIVSVPLAGAGFNLGGMVFYVADCCFIFRTTKT